MNTSIQILVTNIRNELFEIHILFMHKKTYFHEYMIVNDILIEFYKEHINFLHACNKEHFLKKYR